MKLTKQKLFNLIQEALEDYNQSEQDFFGDGIKQIMDQGPSVYKDSSQAFVNPAWLVKNVGRRIGAGYSREVYEIKNTNMVLKVAFPEEMTEAVKSNQYEVDLFNQYPHMFPRTYVYDRSPNGPEWLVIEKVYVVESGPEYAEVVDNTFPSLSNAADLFINAGYKSSPSWVFERLLDLYSTEGHEPDYDLWMDLIFHDRRGRAIDEETRKKVADATWFVATNDEKLMRFITVCKKLGVDFDEIREGNVGTNKERNKLLLIDISKFDMNGEHE